MRCSSSTSSTWRMHRRRTTSIGPRLRTSCSTYHGYCVLFKLVSSYGGLGTNIWDDEQISFFLLLETLVAAHLGLPATGPANTGLASSCAAANSGAHPGVDAGGIRGNCAARLSGIILRAQDRAGDSDDPRESAHNPAEDEPRGHSRRDIDVPFQFLWEYDHTSTGA